MLPRAEVAKLSNHSTKMGDSLSSSEKPEQKVEAEEADDDEPDDW
jgi:hypothetical protein